MLFKLFQKPLKHFGLTSLLLGCLSLTACQRFGSHGGPHSKAKTNTYHFALGAKMVSLDIHTTSDGYSSQAQSLTYESLYEYAFLKQPLELIPNLAESLPQVSKDGKTYTFTLRKGIRYHDDPCFQKNQGKGREVVAQDFVSAFERIADSKLGSPMYSSLETLIAGMKEYKQKKSKTISGVEAVDPAHLRVTLLKKSPRFVFNFLGRSAAPLPAECIKFYGEKLAEHSVGTGPFQITEFSPTRVVAVKNPNYNSAERKIFYPFKNDASESFQNRSDLFVDSGKTVPFLDKVEFEVIEQSQPLFLKFISGDLEQSGVPKDNLGTTLAGGKLNDDLKKRGVQHFQEKRSDIVVQIFNLKDPIWGKNKELRQAYYLALNIPEIIEKMYGGFAVPAESVVNPGDYSYKPNYRSKWSTRNLAMARELLAKAGYPEGKGLPPIVMPNTSDSSSRQSIELIERQIREVGIKLQYEPMSWPEYMSRIKNGKFTVAFQAFVSDVPDPEGAIPMWHSRSIPPNGQNYGQFQNAQYDQLSDAVETLENGPARLKAIADAVSILEEELPVIPIVHRIMNQLYQPWVRNATATDELFIIPWLKYRRLDVSKN